MSKTAGATPDPREFSFKDWFSKFNGGLEFQTNEKLFKQTIYNVIGIFLMISGCLATYGAFMVLNPFLKPLLWALLCGSVLYPFKVRVSKKLERGINSLSKPSIIHVIVDGISYPFVLYNRLSDSLYSFICRNSVPVTVIIVVSCVHFMAPQFSVGFLWNTYQIVFFGLNITLKLGSSIFVVIPLVLTFVWMMLFRWEQVDKQLMTGLSVVTWFSVLCYMTSFADIFHVPSFLGLIVLFIASYVYQYSQNEAKEPPLETSNLCTPPVCSSTPADSPDSFLPKKKSVTMDPSQDLKNLRRTISQRRQFRSQFSFVVSKTEIVEEEHIGDQYLYWVGFACAFMFIIKWWWTPYLIGLHIFALLGKKLFVATGLHKFICDSLNSFSTNFATSVVNDERFVVVFPAPIINLYEIILFSRTKILNILKECCDALSTSIVLLVVIVFFIFASVFITTQVYTEGMYMVKVGSRVLNETLVFSQDNMVPENWQNHLDTAFENAYVYGRDFISKLIRKMLDGANEEKVAELERMLLELYDRIYLAWLASTDDATIGPKVTSDAVYQIWDSLTLNIHKATDLFNVHMITQFINNNMTTLSSAMRNVWEFTLDNIGLILYFLETLISVVLVSGSTVFSFIIDIIIFMTALFYLLASSQEMYKPVEFITKVSPTYGNKLALAIERSVTEVFMVSGKLSLFYGLYTWFLHNLFQMPIIYVPTFIAAIFASVPLLPTYVVCVPGVLDLWLLQGKSVTALCLLLLQFAPTYFVDVAIYEDIHGGHPYLTGLAMAGGVLYFGIEGAITGPLILCMLLVTMNFFASLMKEYYGPSVVVAAESKTKDEH